ncbi:threonine/serine dehydratase [Dongia deserti]|uniref:threonine/serine dehydratase n=1 Tax=Dongia deserti TaxID=2268030 RepID=UPI000E6517EC|nr:threonine/serine dehydratase [Dongia deserti]
MAEAVAITTAAIDAVHPVIAPHVRETPVVMAAAEDFGLSGAAIAFKLELLQHAGSFKPRGAFTNLLTRGVPKAGVVAASGGNHGAAVAFAARRLGIPAKIFVPSVASPAKIAQIKSYGAELVVEGARYADALALSERWVAESGAMPIHAFDQPETLLGQGTVAREFAAQAPAATTWLVAVGGGGLIGGMAAWSAGRHKIVAVEPEAAPTLHMARQAGCPVEAPAGGIAADSLAPKQVGTLMFPIAQRYVAESVLVPDEAIRAAERALWQALRVVAEPGGAAAFAALLSGAYKPAPDERVGVLVCGGNTMAVDFERS